MAINKVLPAVLFVPSDPYYYREILHLCSQDYPCLIERAHPYLSQRIVHARGMCFFLETFL